jgi:hypothetical protein
LAIYFWRRSFENPVFVVVCARISHAKAGNENPLNNAWVASFVENPVWRGAYFFQRAKGLFRKTR